MSDSTTPARTAVARSLRSERGLTGTIGVLGLLVGAAALILGLGWLGTFRAHRPVLDPIVLDWLARHLLVVRIVAVVLGVVLVILGLRWLLRAIRPEPRPNVRFTDDGARLTVSGAALTTAVRGDAEAVTGVTRARVRLAGPPQRPTLRMRLSLREDTDVRTVWEELNTKVLARARQALDTEELPTAVRLDLDTSRRRRVV